MTVPLEPASEWAARRVEQVRDRPRERLALLGSLYRWPGRRAPARSSFRRAAESFMRWQLGRGVLEPDGAPRPGSPWWRALNERLVRDTAEGHALLLGHPGPPSSPAVEAVCDFGRRPSAERWYRAHNLSVVSGYLEHRDLAADEGRVERFFVNLVLVRVLFAHALVAAPRLALGRAAPVAPLLGDPRLGLPSIFVSLARVLPATYPLGDDLAPYLDAELGLGRLIDVGLVQPRVPQLFAWSAQALGCPELRDLEHDGVPSYAWDPTDDEPWTPAPGPVARAARRLLPASGS